MALLKFNNIGLHAIGTDTSIPLCMVDIHDKIQPKNSVLMNAIGAGIYNGTILLNIAYYKILKLSEL